MDTNGTSSGVCRKCGRSLVPASSRRLCPACLFGAALPAAGDVKGGPEGRLTPLAGALPGTAATAVLGMVGSYDLLEQVGQGGMGVVYKARQKGLDRVVALKMLLYGRWTNERFIERFRAEARAAAALNHPGIVGIHDVGEYEGQPWFSMDLISGPSLAELVRDHPLPPRRAAILLKAIAEAVAHAHQRGVLHRDLKPANILLDEHGQPRVTDFGLAKDARTEADLTLSGETLGTPHYLPPEQISGRPDAAKPTADIYSLGAILYHILTGRPPFHADTLEATLMQVLHREPAPPRLLNPDVPRDLENISLKCLEKEPEKRYATAAELAEDLGRFLEGHAVRARTLTPLVRGWRWCRRRPAWAGLLAVATISLLAVLIGSPVALARIRQERNLASAEADRARRSEYAGDMLLAQVAYTENHLRRVDQLLDKHDHAALPPISARPLTSLPAPDLRGWEWHYLRQRAVGDQIAVLRTNWPGVYNHIALSPDGHTLAANGPTNVLLLDTTTGKVNAEIPHAGEWSLGLAFNPNGELVFQDSRGQLHGWSLNPLRENVVLSTDSKPDLLRFSPNGQWLATAGRKEGIALWDWSARRQVHRVQEGSGWSYPRGLAFSNDNELLAWSTRAGEVVLWSLPEQREVGRTAILPGLDAPLCWLEFTPNSRALACSGIDRSLRLFDVHTWQLLHAYTNPTGLARTVCFLTDQRTMLINDDDTTIQVWNWPEWRPERRLRGHRRYGAEEMPAFGHRFYTASWDGSIRSWNAECDPSSDRRLSLTNTYLTSLSPDGATLLTMDKNHFATLWDTLSMMPRFQGQISSTSEIRFWDSSLDSTSEHAVLLDSNRRAHLWSPGTRDIGPLLEGEPVDNLRISSNGHRIVGATRSNPTTDGILQFWDARTRQRVAVAHFPAPPNSQIWSLTVSPDETLVAIGLDSGPAFLWRSTSGAPPKLLREERSSGVLGLAFSADGTRLAGATGGNGVYLWDVATGKELRRLDALTQATRCVAFSPDGKRLAVGGADGSLTIWEPESGQQLLRLPGHPDRPGSIRFLPDGQTIVSLSPTELLVWRTGQAK